MDCTNFGGTSCRLTAQPSSTSGTANKISHRFTTTPPLCFVFIVCGEMGEYDGQKSQKQADSCNFSGCMLP
jgi:hypothetical protein